MQKQFALIYACVIGLAFVAGGNPEKRPVSGYQTVQDTMIHNCGKGWHRDSRSRSCVRD